MLKNQTPALVLVDIQNGFDTQKYFGGNRNNPHAEENCARILSVWRESGLPLFHVKHNSRIPISPLAPGSFGNQIKEIVKPMNGETVIEKDVNSAFIGTNLKELLDKKGIQSLVIVGLTTNHCISTTVRMAGNYGYETVVVSDATATFDRRGLNGEHYSSELIHNTALANLHEEFATVLNADELLKMVKALKY